MKLLQKYSSSPFYIHLSMAVFIVCFALSSYFNLPELLYIGFYTALYSAIYELTTLLNNAQAEKSHRLHLVCFTTLTLMTVGIVTYPVPAMVITFFNLILVGTVVYYFVNVLRVRTLQPAKAIVAQFKYTRTGMLLLLLAVTVLRLFIDSLGLAICNHIFLLFVATDVFDDCKNVIRSTNLPESSKG